MVAPRFRHDPWQPTKDYAALYSNELAMLASMGLTDTKKNIGALRMKGGDVNAALDMLL